MLAEILKPIMGKGLIPADPKTWSVRRRQIVPGFHKAWLEHMVGLFGHCNQPLVSGLERLAATSGKVEMEESSVLLHSILLASLSLTTTLAPSG